MKTNVVLAAALLFFSTSAFSGTFVPPPVVHVAPMVHVAPLHVAPVVRVAPTIKPVVVGHPGTHAHHPHVLPPVVMTTVSQQGKCAETKPPAKECAKK